MPELRIDLGCGERKREGWVGVDRESLPGVDVVSEALPYLQGLASETVDEIYSRHFIEHVDDVTLLVAELARVLRPGGRATIIAPHFSSPFYYSDPTHRSRFGLYSFSYFAEDRILKRSVPTYAQHRSLELTHVRLQFRTWRPKWSVLTWGFKLFVEAAVNLGRWTKEVYEEHWCWLIPCYEVRFELRKIATTADGR